MKYIKTYEDLKDFYFDKTKYIIVTEDEKYVYYNSSHGGFYFLNIDILDDNFFKKGRNVINGDVETFLFDDIEKCKRILKYMNEKEIECLMITSLEDSKKYILDKDRYEITHKKEYVKQIMNGFKYLEFDIGSQLSE